MLWFHPKQAGEYQARLGITSNDADNVEYDGNFFIELNNKALVLIPKLTFAAFVGLAWLVELADGTAQGRRDLKTNEQQDTTEATSQK